MKHDATPQTTIGPDEATDADRLALARCEACWEDGEATDVGRMRIGRLEEIGWIVRVGGEEWEISRSGARVLQDMGV